jgi:hypothetical protein
MKLFAEVETPVTDLVTLGTVYDNIDQKHGTIEFDANNLGRADKLVMVKLTNKAGQVQTVYCSAALSAQIRKDKMPKQQLINYVAGLNIAVTTNEEGEERFKIILTQGAKVSGKVTDVAGAAKVTNLEEIPW